MFEDPVLDELWEMREAEAAKFGNDIDAIYDDFERQERESGREYVSLRPKRIATSGALPVTTTSVIEPQPKV